MKRNGTRVEFEVAESCSPSIATTRTGSGAPKKFSNRPAPLISHRAAKSKADFAATEKPRPRTRHRKRSFGQLIGRSLNGMP